MDTTFSLTHIALSLAAGGLTTLSPCVLPMLPLVVGGAMQNNRYAPLFMGFGMASSFALAGLALGALAPLLDIDPDHIRIAGAALLILFGVAMLIPQWSDRMAQWLSPIATSANQASNRVDARSAWGSVLLGATLGLVWSPCSGPLLGSALTVVFSEGGALRGATTLGLFGIGAAIPLVAAAYLSRAGLSKAQNWLMRHMPAMKKLFAFLLIAIGAAILSGLDKILESYLLGSLPDAWVNLTSRY